jgi:RNA polymerase sigma factor (sigma-70 family)
MMTRTVTAAGARTDSAVLADSRVRPDAFRAVFERHFDAVHRFVRARLGSTLADDIASETFLVAFERRHLFDSRYRSARPWLLGIAANLTRSHHRSETTRLRVLAAQRGTGPTPQESLDRFDPSGPLAAALARLDPDQRETLLLLALGELSYAEIAIALDVPEGTVRSRLNRARAALQEELGP